MNIVGDRIYFRAIELLDKEILLEMINDGETEHSLGGWSYPVSSLQEEVWIKSLQKEKDIMRCMIVIKNSNISIGTVILSNLDLKNGTAEIHLKLIKEAREKGYGSETIKLITQYAFNELRLNCVYAHVNSYNVSSQKVFEKHGFEKDGVLRSRIFKKGSYHDVYSYSLLKGDYDGNR